MKLVEISLISSAFLCVYQHMYMYLWMTYVIVCTVRVSEHVKGDQISVRGISFHYSPFFLIDSLATSCMCIKHFCLPHLSSIFLWFPPAVSFYITKSACYFHICLFVFFLIWHSVNLLRVIFEGMSVDLFTTSWANHHCPSPWGEWLPLPHDPWLLFNLLRSLEAYDSSHMDDCLGFRQYNLDMDNCSCLGFIHAMPCHVFKTFHRLFPIIWILNSSFSSSAVFLWPRGGWYLYDVPFPAKSFIITFSQRSDLLWPHSLTFVLCRFCDQKCWKSQRLMYRHKLSL